MKKKAGVGIAVKEHSKTEIVCLHNFLKMESKPAKKTSEQCFLGKRKPTSHVQI